MIPARPVVVIGGTNLDIRARSEAAPISLTSNPGHTVLSPGGVARNVAENLSRLGSRAVLISRVGDDEFGRLLLAGTRKAGVDVSRVALTGEPTGTYTAVLDDDGELVLGIADMTATATLGATAVEEELLDDGLIDAAAYLVLDGNLRTGALTRALEIARDHDVPVVLDPVGRPKAAAIRDVLRADRPVHTVAPDPAELLGLTGEADVAEAVAVLHSRGVGTVWLTAGGDGSTLYASDGSRVDVPTHRVRPLDVTGAGDALLGAYVHALNCGDKPSDAARFATAAARLTVASEHTVRPDLTEDLVRTEQESWT